MSDPKAAEPFVRSSAFSLTLTTDDDFASGQWRTIPCGIEVKLAPAGTQESERIRASMVKKYGGAKARSLEDIPAAKQSAFAVEFLTRCSFLGFRAPGGRPLEINGEEYVDNLANRQRMLRDFPQIRKEINDELELVQADFGAEREDTEKN